MGNQYWPPAAALPSRGTPLATAQSRQPAARRQLSRNSERARSPWRKLATKGH